MPIVRRSELLAKVEQAPGKEITAGWGAGDVVDVLEMSRSQTRTLLERQPASASMSQTVESIGRGSRTLTCMADCKGAEDGDDPTVVPDWGLLVEACHMERNTLDHLQFDGSGVTSLVKVGDKLTGVSSSATAYVLKTADAVGDTLIEVLVTSGSFSVGEDVKSELLGNIVVGSLHASTVLVTSVALRWQPTTRMTATLQTTGAWSSSDPAAGEVIVCTLAGQEEGGGIVVSVSGTTTTIEWTWGTFTSSASLTTTSGKTAVLNGTLTQVKGKSLTLRPNRAGLLKPLFGVRGNLRLNAEAGAQGRFEFEFTGKPSGSGDSDATLQSGVTLATTVPPRFAGGTIEVDGIPVPTRNFALDLGNSVNMRADANAVEGDAVAEITSRDPTITIEVDQVGTGLIDWEGKWRNSTTMVVGMQLGTVRGNTITVVARKAQVAEIAEGDTDGIATETITLRLRKDTADGDDELYICYV